MKQIKARYFLVIFLIAVSYFVFSEERTEDTAKNFASFQEVTAHLTDNDKNILYSGQSIAGTTKKNSKNRFKYLPQLQEFDSIRSFVKETRPTILYENLYFIPIEDKKQQSLAMIKIFNYLRDVQNLASIKYRNIKKGHIYPVFLSSTEVQSASDTTPISTLKFLSELQEKSRTDAIFVFQDMPPFGNVSSQYVYKYDESFLSFMGSNLSPISYSNIEAVYPNDMLTLLYIIRTERGIFLYGMGSVKISGIAVLFGGVISNSFESRMVGLFTWVKNEFEGKPQL